MTTEAEAEDVGGTPGEAGDQPRSTATSDEHATGADQAAQNRDDEPPA